MLKIKDIKQFKNRKKIYKLSFEDKILISFLTLFNQSSLSDYFEFSY